MKNKKNDHKPEEKYIPENNKYLTKQNKHLTVVGTKGYNIVSTNLPENFFEGLLIREMELNNEFTMEKLLGLVNQYSIAIEFYLQVDHMKAKAYQNRMEYLLTNKDTLVQLSRYKTGKIDENDKSQRIKNSKEFHQTKTYVKLKQEDLKYEDITKQVNTVLNQGNKKEDEKKIVQNLISDDIKKQDKSWKEKFQIKKKKSFKTSSKMGLEGTFHSKKKLEDILGLHKSVTFFPKKMENNDLKLEKKSVSEFLYNEEKKEKDDKIEEIKENKNEEKKEEIKINEEIKQIENEEKKIDEKNEEDKKEVEKNEEKEEKGSIINKDTKNEDKNIEDKNENKIIENKKEELDNKEINNEENKNLEKEEENKEKLENKIEENKLDEKKEQENMENIINNILKEQEEEEKEDEIKKESESKIKKENEENKINENPNPIDIRPSVNRTSIVDEDMTRKIEPDEEISKSIEEQIESLKKIIINLNKKKITNENENNENEEDEDSQNDESNKNSEYSNSNNNLNKVSKKEENEIMDSNVNKIPAKFMSSYYQVESLMIEYMNNFNEFFYQDIFEQFSSGLKELYELKYKKYIEIRNEYHNQIKENEYSLENDENLNEEKKSEIQQTIDSLNEEQQHQIATIEDEFNRKIMDKISEFKLNSFKNNSGIQLLEERVKLDIYSIINESFY